MIILILGRDNLILKGILFFTFIATLSACLSLSYPSSMRLSKSINPNLVLFKQDYQSYWRIGGVDSIEEDSIFYPLRFTRFDEFGVNDNYLIIVKRKSSLKVKYYIYSYEYFSEMEDSKWVFKFKADSTGLYSIADSLRLPVNTIRPLDEWLK